MEKNNQNFVGRHLIMDVQTYTPSLLSDTGAIYNFMEIFSKVVDMTLVYPPIVARFPWASCELEKFVKDLKDENIRTATIEKMEALIARRSNDLAGVSGITVWLESHAAIHTWTEENFFSFDAYSCKDFEIEKAVNFISSYFDIKSYRGVDIIRTLNAPQEIKLLG